MRFATSGRARSRRSRWLIAVVLAAATAVVLGAGAAQVAADSPATSVLDWNKHALDALNNPPTNATTPGAGMTPPVQAVHMAMVQGAVYDAVNSIARGYRPYLDVPRAPRSASQAAATATAAHDVLVSVLNQAPLTATFTAAGRSGYPSTSLSLGRSTRGGRYSGDDCAAGGRWHGNGLAFG